MIVTDASLWVSILTPQDTFHGASQQWLAAFLAGPDHSMAAPRLLLLEISASRGRRGARPLTALRPARRLARDPQMTLVDLDERLLWQASRVAVVAGLRAGDALYVAVARQLGAPLLTWDAEQLRRSARVGVRARQPDPADSLALLP